MLGHNKKFLESLMKPGRYVELRAIRIGQGITARTFADSADVVDRFALRYGRDAEIYMGIAPRLSRDGGGGLSNCDMPAALWIDADNERAARTELALFDIEPSAVIRSGGGLHVYWFLRDEPAGHDQVKQALRQLARRLEGDMKSAEPAHILRVPGTMNHKYRPPRMVEVEIFEPSRLYLIEDMLAATTLAGHSAAYIRARSWMAELPPAVQGEHGDDATYRAACMLIRDMGLSVEEAFELMRNWNERCIPPWSSAELMKKIRGAEAYGQNERGSGDPARDFAGFGGGNGDFGEDIDDSRADLDRLSKMFKVVDDDGALRIYRRDRDEALGRAVWRRYNKTDFLNIGRAVLQLRPKMVGKTLVPMAEYWLDHYRGKHTYNGMTMRPDFAGECTPDGMLNMWSGFAYVPRPGDWSLLKSMIFESVCRWDDKSYDYVLNWMARAVQRPWEPAGTALVLRGKKGTGKGTLGRAFYRMFGQHGMHFASRDLLTGRFNAHLRDCVALFADEAFYAGDKVGESVLKAFITEPALVYEEKGKNPVMGRNYLHVVMASNLDWVVPAGMDNERRFAVFEVEDCGYDKRWWDRLHAELNAGGMEAMLHDLMHRDISEFEIRLVPQTTALAAQRAHAMDHLAAWLLDMADGEWQDFGEPEEGKPLTFLGKSVYDSFMSYCEERNLRNRPNTTSFGISIRKYMPENFPKKIHIRKEGRQCYFYVFPEAEKCAEHIRSMLGIQNQ